MSSSHPPVHPSHTLADLGWNDRWQLAYESLDSRADDAPARILRHDGSSVLAGTATDTRHVHLRPAVPPLAVGDWVTIRGEVVAELLDRRSLLQRRDPSTGLSQPIAANIDVVGIVCGLDRPVSVGRIERFSTLAWDAGASPLVILSKSDLVSDTSSIEAEIFSAIPGSDVVAVSSNVTQGIDELLSSLAEQTLVLVGESGAGKSTLLNALAGRHAADTGSVRAGDHKGRHTTTARALHLLPGRCCLIDTPGVREVGLFTDVATVEESFSDIADLATQCRFNDCEHATEPGCAVLAAIEDGTLPNDRLDSWRSLRREAASAELRADRAAYRKESRRLGKIYRGATDHKEQGR